MAGTGLWSCQPMNAKWEAFLLYVKWIEIFIANSIVEQSDVLNKDVNQVERQKERAISLI